VVGCGAGLEAARAGRGFGLFFFFQTPIPFLNKQTKFEFKPGFESKHPKTMHRHECNTHNYLFNLEKTNRGFFFLYYISCKEK
jgi:hypothetical protein